MEPTEMVELAGGASYALPLDVVNSSTVTGILMCPSLKG